MTTETQTKEFFSEKHSEKEINKLLQDFNLQDDLVEILGTDFEE